MKRLSLLVIAATAVSVGSTPLTLTVDWSSVKVTTHTAATVEVDVMPFLGRTDYGGPFNSYYQSLANLGSEFVRYAPWFPNPRVVVPELEPSDCTATKPATNWNSTYFDGIVRDFMAAVCGPNAVNGECEKSVVQQLSTMPGWLYKGGNTPSDVPDYPWDTPVPFSKYTAGKSLVDPTCGEFARAFARIVSHYTNSGHHDECGHWHASGFNYSWWGVSVLNEDEHHIAPDDGQAYTVCYDAIKKEVAKVNPGTVLVGPEICCRGPDYLLYFLNASNHDDGQAPAVASYHQAMSASGSNAEDFYTSWDSILNGYVQTVEQFKATTGQQTELVINEFIPFVGDWCDCEGVEHLCEADGGCPNWQDPKTAGGDPNLQHAKGIGMNKKTVAWNAAAGVFAYGYGTLAELKYKFVGQDQLIGGTWPDNEPAVTCLDWQTGQPNAKYWVINLLATTVGDAQEKSVMHSNISGVFPPPPPVPAGETGTGLCGVTENGKDCSKDVKGAWTASAEGITDLAGCVKKVGTCTQGNYASYSSKHDDCSWYASCDMDSLLKVGAGYESQVLHARPSPPPPAEDSLYALPYIKGGAKGVLLVNKKSVAYTVTIAGATGGTATVLEATGDTPGMNPPVARQITSNGSLELGPFAVAVITKLETSA